MSMITQFRPHLPFLRRYARALTGTQQSGDAYILASLEALRDKPGHVVEASNARVTLYRFFHAIWSTTGAQLETSLNLAARSPDARLRKLAPIDRQAFLLTTLEDTRKNAGRTRSPFGSRPPRYRKAAHHIRADNRG